MPVDSCKVWFVCLDDSIFSPTFLQRVASERGSNKKSLQRGKMNSLDAGCPESPTASPGHVTCSTTVLLLVFHAGSVLGTCLVLLLLVEFIDWAGCVLCRC